MLTVAFDNYRIAIDFYPYRIIVYNGKEVVNQKASKTEKTHHDFNDIIDGKEVNYEVTIKPCWPSWIVCNGFIEIKRDGKLIFNLDDYNVTKLEFNYMGHSLKQQYHGNSTVIYELLFDDKVVCIGKKNLFSSSEIQNATFTINENGKDFIYEYKRLDSAWKNGFSLTRNSKLLFRLDQSKTDANIENEKAELREQKMEDAEVMGKLVGHAVNTFTGGSGTEVGAAIKSVSKTVQNLDKK